jgi:cyclopropane fatty-acyl-phospholipid synthase-like methyltransferase
MKLKYRPETEKIIFPVLTNLRNTKKKVKNMKGKIKLKYDYINDFVFNDAFNEKKIKYSKNYNNEQSESSIFQTHLNDVFKIIKSNFKKEDKIVEIGCGKGTFFEILEKNYKYNKRF